MTDQVERVLRDFPRNPRDNGRQLAAMLKNDAAAVRGCITKYLCNGAEENTARYAIGLLDRETNVLDMLLDPSLTSVTQARGIAKLAKQVVPRLDVDLAKALRTAGKERTVRILRLLAEVADSNRTLPLLMRVIREKGPEARAQACRILAQHCQNETFVEQALSDPDRTVRAGAIDGVGLRSQRSMPAILKAAMNDEDPQVRTHALLAAFRLGEADAKEGLLQLARDHQPTRRALAAWAMGEARHDCFLETLIQLQRDPNEQVRKTAEVARKQIEAQDQSLPQEQPETRIETPIVKAPICESGVRLHIFRSRVSREGKAEFQVGLFPPEGVPIQPSSQRDFAVEVDGRPVKDFEWSAPSTQRPLNVALVLDYSSNMPATKIIEMQTAALAAIRGKRENDEFAFFKYSVEVDKTSFSPDSKRLGALVRRPFPGTRKLSRLHDALAEAAGCLSEAHGERVVIVIAEGGDRGSELSLWKALHLLDASHAVMFVVQYGQGSEQPSLRELSTKSGGRYFHYTRGVELTHCLQDLVAGLANCHRFRFGVDVSPERDLCVRIHTPLGIAEAVAPIGRTHANTEDR